MPESKAHWQPESAPISEGYAERKHKLDLAVAGMSLGMGVLSGLTAGAIVWTVTGHLEGRGAGKAEV